ncbi:hypothetical protein BLOT_010232 [Blomia tropicalis]|nr:hypothetical protein BLOT_010232 [Blomia tropicalis]
MDCKDGPNTTNCTKESTKAPEQQQGLTPRHLTLAVRKDKEINNLLFDVIFSEGDLVITIEP